MNGKMIWIPSTGVALATALPPCCPPIYRSLPDWQAKITQ